MSNPERVMLGLTLIRVSVFVMYALVGAVCYRRLYARLSPFCGRLAAGMLLAQAAVIFLAIPQHPSSIFDQWLWDVHEEGNIPATLASAQLALVAGVALIAAWLARTRPGWQRLYLAGIGLVFLFVARDEYVSMQERIDNWERFYIALGALVAAATAVVAYRSARCARVWHVCLLSGLALSAAGAIPLESNPLFCGRWDFLPLDGCHWTHYYEESLEFLGIWLVLVGLLGQLSEAAQTPRRLLRAFLLALPPLWILLLMLGSLLPRLELAFVAKPADVQFESGLRLRGTSINQHDIGINLWLYAESRTPDYLDQGYTIHIVDQDSGAAILSWDAPIADPPAGILLAPARDHIYRQHLTLNLPPDLPGEREYWLTLSAWRASAGVQLTQKILSSDLTARDAEQIILAALE